MAESLLDQTTTVVNQRGFCDWRPEVCAAGVCQCRALAREVLAETVEFMKELARKDDTPWTESKDLSCAAETLEEYMAQTQARNVTVG